MSVKLGHILFRMQTQTHVYFLSKWTTLATVGREIIEDAEGVSYRERRIAKLFYVQK